jgi:hypothetical protein
MRPIFSIALFMSSTVTGILGGPMMPLRDRMSRVAATTRKPCSDSMNSSRSPDQFPGPLLRLEEGRRVIVDIHNDTDTPELVHWHGQMIPSDIDGAAEEGTPFVPAHGMRRIELVPRPSGFRLRAPLQSRNLTHVGDAIRGR